MKDVHNKNRINGVKEVMARILIADDNQKFVKNIRRLLETDARISIIGEANTGREAITLALELKPNIILLDIQMPEVNGLQVTSVLKGNMPDLKVIIVTLFDLDEYSRLAKESGADSLILKKNIYRGLIPEIYGLMGFEDAEKLS